MFWRRRPRESREEARARADALERILDRHLERLLEALLEARSPAPAAAAGTDAAVAGTQREVLPPEVEAAIAQRYDPSDVWYRVLAGWAIERLARGEREEDVIRAIRDGADPATFGV